MPLSKDEADALRQCSRILYASLDQSERRSIAINIEDFIKKGKWPHQLPTDIARLFYPSDTQREKAMLSQMLKEFGDRPGLPLSAADLSAWADCPPVPKNSPLRFWLPEFMHETDSPVKKSYAEKTLQPIANWKMLIQAQAAILWREYKALNCSPTKNSIKGDLAKWCRDNKIITKSGISPSEDYIYRHVLRGWTPPTG